MSRAKKPNEERWLTSLIASMIVSIGVLATPAAAALIVDIQPVSVCMDDGTSCGALSYDADELKTFYLNEANITLNILPSRTFNSTTYQTMDDLTEVNNLLFANPSLDPSGPSGFFSSPITLWFANGSAGVSPTLGLAVINGNRAWVDSTLVGVDETVIMAHELGHTLGLQHVFDPANLMFPSDVPGTDLLSLILDSAQKTTIQASQFVYAGTAPIPLPSTLLLLVSGLAALAWRRRQRLDLTPACA